MIPDPTVTLPPIVDVPDTLIFCRNVAFVFVLIFSVAAIPVNADPLPEYDVAVTVPDTFTFCRKVAFVLVLIFQWPTPVNAEPSNAGNAPVKLLAARAPLNVVAVTIPVANKSPSGLIVIPDPTRASFLNVAIPATSKIPVLTLSVPAAPTTVAIPVEN